MRSVLRFFVLARCLLAGIAPGFAAAPPVLDVAAVPAVGANGRAEYAAFLLADLPRAFALSPSGAFAWQGGRHDGATRPDDVRAKALANCAKFGGQPCEIYAEDLQVVWHGAPPVALAKPSGPLPAVRDYALIYDERYFWYGPAAARGVFVYGHGKGENLDRRTWQAQNYVRVFNNAGFDVIRVARAPRPDTADGAAAFLRSGLAALRARGWRTIVAGGQSRGAWDSLQILDTPGLADAVIAMSPAKLVGTNGIQQETQFDQMAAAARAPAARVVVAQFEGDTYNLLPDARTRAINTLLAPHVAALLYIDRPRGISGHDGATSVTFARRFGPCLLRFVTQPVPLAACPEVSAPPNP